MLLSNGAVCGSDNSSPIISQSTFVVDIPGNRRFTRMSTFQHDFQNYTACAASINDSTNSNHFFLDTLEVLPCNMYMDGMKFIVLLCGQPLTVLASRFHNCFCRRMAPDLFVLNTLLQLAFLLEHFASMAVLRLQRSLLQLEVLFLCSPYRELLSIVSCVALPRQILSFYLRSCNFKRFAVLIGFVRESLSGLCPGFPL